MSSDYFLALVDHYKAVRARLNGSPPPVPLALAATEHALIVALSPPPPEPPPPPPEPEPPPPEPDPLLGLACSPETRRALRDALELHGLTWDEVSGRSNRRACLDARASVYVVLRARGWSYPKIGALVGGRDHTSVINSVQRYHKRKESNK